MQDLIRHSLYFFCLLCMSIFSWYPHLNVTGKYDDRFPGTTGCCVSHVMLKTIIVLHFFKFQVFFLHWMPSIMRLPFLSFTCRSAWANWPLTGFSCSIFSLCGWKLTDSVWHFGLKQIPKGQSSALLFVKSPLNMQQQKDRDVWA